MIIFNIRLDLYVNWLTLELINQMEKVVEKKFNALSLFNGMSFGYMALKELGFELNKYYSSEIDKYAIKAANALFIDTIQLGDILNWREWDIDWASIGFLMGGSPCQGFSFAGGQAGTKAILDGVEHLVTTREMYLEFKEKGAEFLSCSHLFWEYILCLDHVKLANPDVKFFLENVKMKKELLNMITDAIGVEPICINSALVSAQNRVRYYWTNIDGVEKPKDEGVILADILEDLPSCPIGIAVREKSNCMRVGGKGSPFDSKQIWDSPFKRISKKGQLKPSIEKSARLTGGANSGGNHSDMDILVIQKPRGNNPGGDRALDGKTPCVSANSWQHNNHVKIDFTVRRFSVRECFRLQTVPEHYIDILLSAGISNTQLYKMCGNGWTHKVIVHIFKGLI